MTAEQRETIMIMTVSPRSEAYWRGIYKKYDKDNDGRISYLELKEMIESNEYGNDWPETFTADIMERADKDKSGYLEEEEFINMMHDPDLRSVFGHYIETYIRLMVPAGRHVQITGRTYEEEYWRKRLPVSLVMIIFSILEITLFAGDAIFGYTTGDGKIGLALIYHPETREQAWRFITYMFVHYGYGHLIHNLILQLILGFPLEMVHCWWRILVVYMAGVAAGSLATSLIQPDAIIAGASAGVFALCAAHLACVIINWKDMNYYSIGLQLLVFVLLTSMIFVRPVGLVVHLSGAIAGLLVGICVLRNVTQKKWEKHLWWVMMGTYFILMFTGIIIHICINPLPEEE